MEELIIKDTKKGLIVTGVQNRNIEEICIPDDVVAIKDKAFRFCTKLKIVHLPKNLAHVGAGAFEGCHSLPVYHSVRYADTVAVEYTRRDTSYYSYAFEKKRAVRLKKGTKFIHSHAFMNAQDISELILPDSVIEIGESAFDSACIKEISIPDNVTSIGKRAFMYSAIDTLKMPTKLNKLEDELFSCSLLSDFVLPLSVVNIGKNAFSDCNFWHSLKLNDNLTRIGESAFLGSNIRYFCIPPKIRTIYSRTLGYCEILELIYIHSSRLKIKSFAFENSKKIEKIFLFPKDPKNIIIESKSFPDLDFSSVELLIPQGSRNLYIKHEFFSNFMHIKEYDDNTRKEELIKLYGEKCKYR